MCTAETSQSPPSHAFWAHIRGRYWSAKIDDISLWPSGHTLSLVWTTDSLRARLQFTRQNDCYSIYWWLYNSRSFFKIGWGGSGGRGRGEWRLRPRNKEAWQPPQGYSPHLLARLGYMHYATMFGLQTLYVCYGGGGGGSMALLSIEALVSSEAYILVPLLLVRLPVSRYTEIWRLVPGVSKIRSSIFADQ